MRLHAILLVRQSPVRRVKPGVRIVHPPAETTRPCPERVRIRVLRPLIRSRVKLHVIHEKQRVIHVPVQRSLRPELGNPGIHK